MGEGAGVSRQDEYRRYFGTTFYALLILWTLVRWRIAPWLWSWAKGISRRKWPVLLLCAPELLLIFTILLVPTDAYASGSNNLDTPKLVTQQSEIPAAELFPDAARLLSDVQKNQKGIDQILESYTYTKVEEELALDNKGQTKSKRVRQYEVFYVNGREVQKLVARDEKDLSPLEQAKEQERVRRLVLKYVADGAEDAGYSRPEGQDEDELHISTFLRAARFTHPRRERFRGQEVIAFDIEPNPRYHAQNLNERLVQRLEGVMWVDERAHQVVRLEARLSNSAKIGGGLLGSVQKGSEAVFEQTLINNEVWLPSYLEEHLSGRFLVFKSYREDFVIRYRDYKKFRVDTETKTASPKLN